MTDTQITGPEMLLLRRQGLDPGKVLHVARSPTCNCRVFALEDDVHVFACSRPCEPVIEKVAAKLAGELDITLEMRGRR